MLERIKEYDPFGDDGPMELFGLAAKAPSEHKPKMNTKRKVRLWDLVLRSQEYRPVGLVEGIASTQCCVEAFTIAQQGRHAQGAIGRGYDAVKSIQYYCLLFFVCRPRMCRSTVTKAIL